jgi:hypothetical protein
MASEDFESVQTPERPPALASPALLRLHPILIPHRTERCHCQSLQVAHAAKTPIIRAIHSAGLLEPWSSAINRAARLRREQCRRGGSLCGPVTKKSYPASEILSLFADRVGPSKIPVGRLVRGQNLTRVSAWCLLFTEIAHRKQKLTRAASFGETVALKPASLRSTQPRRHTGEQWRHMHGCWLNHPEALRSASGKL